MRQLSLLNSYSKEDLENLVAKSNSWHDLSKKIGYNCNSGDLKKQIQKRIEIFNIDVSHFKRVAKTAVQRNEENIFIENSTADQSVVRRWYKKNSYTPYKCSICEMEPFWNGKKLTLILDHINGKNTDNRIENLRWVCPNCNMQLPTTNRRKTNTFYDADCKKITNKNQETLLSVLPVTREELKSLIRTTPFVKIGEKFKVTDNTIRKWCDKLGLPRRVCDIKKYSDEEWSKI